MGPFSASASADKPSAVLVTLYCALGYAALSWLALQLPLAAGVASPIYPAAGLALAAVLIYGTPGAVGACLGALLTNALVLASREAEPGWPALTQPVVTALGAGLQAALGAWLIRRSLGESLVLGRPGEVLRAGIWGGVVACVLNASLSVGTLTAMGATSGSGAAYTWWTWWVGDTLGVLIGAPVALSFIGRPRTAWRTRRVSVALPMSVATLLLGAAFMLFQGWEQDRQRRVFESATQAVSRSAQAQLDDAMGVLQVMYDSLTLAQRADAAQLRKYAGWWLQHVPELQAVGLSERVAKADVAAFEAEIRAEGAVGFRVFDRPESMQSVLTDSHAVVVRAIEPARGNEAAVGVNALSVPAAREAILAAAQSARPAASRSFRLTQSRPGAAVGTVVYRVLPRLPATEGSAGATPDWRGLVFVTLVLEPLLAKAVAQSALPDIAWCLLEPDPRGAAPRVVAQSGGCDTSAAVFRKNSSLALADRQWELQLQLPSGQGTTGTSVYAWVLSVLGMAATSMLGLLLLTVTGRARRIETAVKERTLALSNEVRERREVAQALRHSEHRLRSILDHLPLGVVFLDAQGRLLDSNPDMARLLGRTVQQCNGLSFPDIIHPDEHWHSLQAWVEVLNDQRTEAQQTLRLMRPDGSSVWVRMTVTALRDGGAKPTRLVGVVEDITEHLRVAEIERTRDAALAANRAKSEFVSRMSHELRTPLNAMLGFAQLLSMDQRPALALHQDGWTTQIQKAGWHLLDLINETLDLSRIEAGAVSLNPQLLPVQPALEAAVALLAPAALARSITVTVQPAAPGLMVWGDDLRLRQILSNLLSNAIKYNREGGQVKLQMLAEPSGKVTIEVHDTGLGMSHQQLQALFQAYNRLGRENSAVEGTGIGLAISQGLAELMGGSLRADSVLDEGSVFRLTLPAGPGNDGGHPQPPEAKNGSARHSVHYIEDNEINVLLMQGMLAQRPGLSLTVSCTVSAGREALQNQLPDLVLLDMHLPDGDGLGLLRQMKANERTASIPVIVVSADATPERVEQALTLGATRYVTKPIDLATLLRAVDEVIGGLQSRWL